MAFEIIMKIIEHIRQDGPFGEYRVKLSEEEKQDQVNGKTFRALSIAERVYNRFGIVAAMFVAIPLAIWSDFSK